MSDIDIRELAIPGSEGAPGWEDLVARTDLYNALLREEVGTNDLAETPQETLSYLTVPYATDRLFGAYDRDRLVGFGEFSVESGHSVCWGWIGVAADHRRAGIATRLAGSIYRCAREAGSTTVETGVDHSDLTGGARLQSPVSPGSVPADAPSTRFLLSQGFKLGQVEITSGLALPVPDELLTQLLEQARPAHDYELVDWTGPTPAELVEGYARLRTVMTTAMPAGQLEVDTTVWDAERVRQADESNARAGSVTITTVAKHRPTSELVAFTRLGYPAAATGQSASQGFTLVLPEHRGHNLGLRIKINNLRLLNAADHGAARITTSNADENAAMLVINRALGFRPFMLRSAWQKKLFPR